MGKWVLFFALGLCSGCFTRSALMTRGSFDELHLGAPASEVVARVGRPYKVHTLSSGREEYEYIERLSLGKNLVMENHYFLVLVEGRLISKRFSQERPPLYDIIYHDDPTLSY
ncbi:MAG: hypothetical protein A2Y28_00785 [Chlamydiae bacterium GWC2_50_10]|nr:MAG: hypothetical protein A2Z85_02870 [Chlamydiae bacterium GWA2_50_15]OGN54188.1 MAG: hypothetical protein A2Y28_00785 [Chlamydiae bacterium GWC2_50_10]OGN64172.1 MAG: hypothetical protein A3E26_01215 [Chlamydiae bacterium RIFCSPHIGHO2_12_FULL_49_32]OGN69180.1 MAG: hypothetical protein A3I15_00960 [Chlamydiae bacterium RIFCSPLOWO2_02_FULL_49_12]OGN73399.1 MAG: hypothetical protein A3G30_02860 [Chlamydiae bacterium RIFCSPLOWO2_12_FULL_49_12]HAZ15466.1 hypothetical protein [Parachlamydiales 